MTKTADAPPVFVRTASKRDLPHVQSLLVETWHDTYDEIFGFATVKEITDEWHAIEALEKRLSVPASEFIVADDGTNLHAMAFAAQREKTVELHQLYVLPGSQGRGIGTQLMQEVFFCFDSATDIQLDVHPENENAIAFYQSGGFEEVGRMEVPGPGGLSIPHVILSRKLDS